MQAVSWFWRVAGSARTVLDTSSVLYKRVALIGVLVAQRGGWWAAVKAAATIIRSEGIQGLQLRLKKAQPDIRAYHDSPEDADYVNVLATTRANVLLSDQHVRLLNALRGKSFPACDHAKTLGLSLATHNSAGRLPGFFESLLTQSFPLSRLNVAVVDCGSTDATRAVLENHLRDHGTRYASFTIYNRVDPELQQGHDQAIRQLSDHFVLVSNASLELHTGTIERALQAASADSEDIAAWELRQHPNENLKYYDPVTLESLWNSHTCVLMRRAAYLQVGGYDSQFQGYSEDVELSHRLRGAGWKLRYLPQISVTSHVDPIDPSLKALHWARSAGANVLLRHRFASPLVAAEGEAFLSQAHDVKRAAERRQALTKVQEVVDQNRTYFCQTMRPERRTPFPFLEFDYVMSRQGASVRLPPRAPRQRFPRVTVVTRTHGSCVAMLREAIASVLNQNYPQIEHLVVEDRTSFAGDLVGEVARAYRANIRYLKSNGPGRAAAGNVGLASATGELVMFLDNDDLIFPDHVELLVRTLETHPSLVGAYALSWEVHTRTNGQGRYREVMHVLPGSQWLDFDRRRLAKANYIPIQSMLFRRSLFERAGGFRDDLDHLEDWNLWWRYAQHGNFMLVRKITSLYRTPAEPEIRAHRQAELDKAYDRVRLLNSLIETYR